jgi:hypothetical protein
MQLLAVRWDKLTRKQGHLVVSVGNLDELFSMNETRTLVR